MRLRSSVGATPMPMPANPCPRLLEKLGGMQQRLGRDAADVEARAAICGALLDDRHFHAELRRADGAHIAARPAADDDQIIAGPAIDPSQLQDKALRILEAFLNPHTGNVTASLPSTRR